MHQEQFGQFWTQLKAPLKAKWDQITDEDVSDIQGDMARFSKVLQTRYDDKQQSDVTTWVNRRYSHWTGNYIGYQDPQPTSS